RLGDLERGAGHQHAMELEADRARLDVADPGQERGAEQIAPAGTGALQRQRLGHDLAARRLAHEFGQRREIRGRCRFLWGGQRARNVRRSIRCMGASRPSSPGARGPQRRRAGNPGVSLRWLYIRLPAGRLARRVRTVFSGAAMFRTLLAVSVLAGSVLAALCAAPASAQQAPPTPAPELAKLKLLEGNWEGSGTAMMEPGKSSKW